jgi:hypothetical protein
MKRSWLSKHWFYPLVVITLVAGNVLDLFGTYLWQPLDSPPDRAVPMLLERHGHVLVWSPAIVVKILVCIVCAFGLRQFLHLRRVFYPERDQSFRVFLTHFFYGRGLGWVESCFQVPLVAPALMWCCSVLSLGGPLYAYMGYGHLAAKCGWWRLSGFRFGPFWFDAAVILLVLGPMIWLCWQMWQDYREGAD